MKKFLIISIIILAVFAAGAFIYAQYNDLPDAPQPHVNGPAELGLNLPKQNSQPTNQLTSEKDGIQMTIDSVERVSGQTVVKLTMDNHVYDLGEFNVKSLSSLNNVKPSDYKIAGNQVGGHHLEASLVFLGDLRGELVVGLKDDLRFEFDIIGSD